jgi:hypothetical protein
MFFTVIFTEYPPEMQQWIIDQGWVKDGDVLVRPYSRGVKNVFMPSRWHENEYAQDGWEATFNDRNKAIQFKMVWADYVRKSYEGLGV